MDHQAIVSIQVSKEIPAKQVVGNPMSKLAVRLNQRMRYCLGTRMFKEFVENKNAKLPSSQYRGWAIWRTGTILLGAYRTFDILSYGHLVVSAQ